MEINYTIRWIEIYPMDSVIQHLNNQGLVSKCSILFYDEWWVPTWLFYAIGLETFASQVVEVVEFDNQKVNTLGLN